MRAHTELSFLSCWINREDSAFVNAGRIHCDAGLSLLLWYDSRMNAQTRSE